MTTVLVDWLGRGGIAQTTEAWARELDAAGEVVVVVTRPGRELAGAPVTVVKGPERRGRIATHRDLATTAARTIEERRPKVVVVANYLIPPLEVPVYEAARRVGARIVLVVHDHRLHTRLAGTWVGMRRHVKAADVVVAHTRFVAKGVASGYGRNDVVVVPHPLPVGLLGATRPPEPPLGAGPEAVALHFGVLHRRYKGTATVVDLARSGVNGWRFALVGEGAPADVPGTVALQGFVEPGLLLAAVEQSDATLLPYRVATQSGAVVLAQALGSVAVASAVGGIPDQIDDGVDGRLVAAGAGSRAWAGVLSDLSDPGRRSAIAAAGRRRVQEGHRRFVGAIKELVA